MATGAPPTRQTEPASAAIPAKARLTTTPERLSITMKGPAAGPVPSMFALEAIVDTYGSHKQYTQTRVWPISYEKKKNKKNLEKKTRKIQEKQEKSRSICNQKLK
jgi:hypothetical protein